MGPSAGIYPAMKYSVRNVACLVALGTAILPGFAPCVEAQQAAGAAPAQSTFTLRTGTNLVVEDVTVTGGDGRPVHGLKAQDFALAENGTPQHIRNFSEHSFDPHAAHASVAAPKLAAGIFTNYAPQGSAGPANVLLLDMLNTPLRDQQYARQQILHFLDHAPAGTQIAIFGLGSQLTLLQGFTSDFSLLKAALSRKRASGTSSLLDDSLGGGGGGNTSATGISEALADNATAPDTQELVANAQQFEADSQSFQLNLRAVFTLDALNEMARYLSNIAGRKNLIWFSGSFPVDLLPSTSTANGFASMASHEGEFRETMTLLARSQVALYPVDARGLQTTGTFNAASQSTRYNRDATNLGKDIASFDAQNSAENSSMLAAARETGGQAFINTNGLSEAVVTAIENGSSYYTLTYNPATGPAAAAKAADSDFRKISVSLPGKQYTLAYRRGYYPEGPEGPKDASAPEAKDHAGRTPAGSAAASSPITRSMMRGAPAPTEIEFTVRVRPETGRNDDSVAPGNELATKEKGAAPPFLRLAVDYAVDQHSLAFHPQQGKFRGDFEFLTFVYDASGTLLNRAGSTLHADFTPAVYANFLRQPFSFNQDISVPRGGDLFLRIAVHDLNTERVGAMEIPVDAVRKLPTLDARSGQP